MLCGVFVGTADPLLDIPMEEGEPACQHATAILVCEEGHAYPAIPCFNFCPMHGHKLTEVALDR